MIDRPPVIFSTLGDASGIGPELVARTLKHPEATADVKRLVVGNRRIFDMGREVAGVETDLPAFDNPHDAIASPEPVVFLDYAELEYGDIPYGISTEQAGKADLATARYAVDLFNEGLIDGFVFAPVNKKSLHMGGSRFEGYKAYFADYMGFTGKSAEINTIGHLWTTRVSSHIPISEVPKHVTKDNVLNIIRYFDRELRRFGYSNPKIAVSGLNPHNGDGGLFGTEEIEEIEPAVAAARKFQINVSGPFSPDTIFLTVQQENYLGVVSMYHDQCQIATKLMDFDEGVTYFGGLPFPVTTPAHGTAFDIAGQGKASPTPILNALKLSRRALLTARGAAFEETADNV